MIVDGINWKFPKAPAQEPNKIFLSIIFLSISLNKVKSSFEKNSDFIRKNRTKIYLVSSGFHEIIDPIAEEFNIIKNHIYANNFIFDDNEIVTGFDDKNVLSMDKGKVEIVKNLNLDGTIHVIGDGYTDYEIKKEGFADYFYLFAENIKRESLINSADFLVKSLDQVIKIVEWENFHIQKIR